MEVALEQARHHDILRASRVLASECDESNGSVSVWQYSRYIHAIAQGWV